MRMVNCFICGAIEERYNCEPFKCQECGSEVKFMGPFYVNTYLVDLAYGGPQEGGWHYNCGEPVDSRWCDTYEEAKDVLEVRKLWCREENIGRKPISSVLSAGQYEVWIEDHFAAPYPESRPHYE